MAKLIYTAITSLDGYVADENGNFDWAAPDDEVHQFVNDLERPIGTYLYGRRLYEVMVGWETMPNLAEQPAVTQRLRPDLATSGEDCLLAFAGGNRRRQDADRACLRPECSAPAQGASRARHQSLADRTLLLRRSELA